MGARIRMPLRMLLPCLAVCLAASGAAAFGVAGVSAADGYVMRQADDDLRACASSMLSHGLVAVPGSGPVPGQAMPGACGMELLSASGQLLIPAALAASGPVIPASGSWLAAHLAGPVTVPGAGGGGRWRVVITAVHYQAQRMLFVYGPDDLRYVISGRTGHGYRGMLVVTAQLAGTGQAAAGYAAAAGTVLVLLAAAAFALTRAILRPLREAAVLAGNASQGAGDRLVEVMARLGVLANRDHGRDGMTLARMRERLQASHAAEAEARRSAAGISEQLGETCLQLRRSVSILRGFAEYCRKREKPLPASLDRMLHRVTGEITRMETLVEGLHMRSAGESTGLDRRPDPPATVPAAYTRLQNNRELSASADHAT
jgi:signal transduction histidine kinase